MPQRLKTTAKKASTKAREVSCRGLPFANLNSNPDQRVGTFKQIFLFSYPSLYKTTLYIVEKVNGKFEFNRRK
jgi:hypothetical protein